MQIHRGLCFAGERTQPSKLKKWMFPLVVASSAMLPHASTAKTVASEPTRQSTPTEALPSVPLAINPILFFPKPKRKKDNDDARPHRGITEGEAKLLLGWTFGWIGFLSFTYLAGRIYEARRRATDTAKPDQKEASVKPPEPKN